MLELLLPMTAVLASWLLFSLVFCGLGVAALKALGQSPRSGWLWLDSFWLGWVIALGGLQLWHFVLPVNDAALMVLAAIAFALLLWQRDDLARIIRRAFKDKALLALLALLALWLSNRALGMTAAYDTGFRDMQAVMWIDAYPLAPGLANLFSSLGLNQSVYLYDALLDAFIWSDRSHYIATGLLILLYLVYSARAALCLFRCGGTVCLRWSWIFAVLTTPYVLFYTAAWGGITHFLTDTVVDLVGFVSMIYLLDFLQDWRQGGGEENYLIHRLALVVLAGFTVKQSFFIFGAAISVFVCLVWLRRCHFRLTGSGAARTILPAAIAAGALMLPWMARGAVTSGYIAFPQSFGRLDVDWVIPAEQVQERQLNMSANTRLRGGDRATTLASWDWLGPWLRRFAGNVMSSMTPTFIAVAGLGLYFIGRSRAAGAKQEQRLSPWILTPLLATLLIWFLTYPEPKYARYLFWSLAAIAVILALQAWGGMPLRKRKAMIFALAAVCLSYVIYLTIQLGAYPQPAGPERGFYPIPAIAHEVYLTDSGLTLHIPADEGPQCWRIPLPCSPYPNARLEARVPGELRHGFRIADNDIVASPAG